MIRNCASRHRPDSHLPLVFATKELEESSSFWASQKNRWWLGGEIKLRSLYLGQVELGLKPHCPVPHTAGWSILSCHNLTVGATMYVRLKVPGPMLSASLTRAGLFNFPYFNLLICKIDFLLFYISLQPAPPLPKLLWSYFWQPLWKRWARNPP